MDSILFDGVNNPETLEEVVGQAIGAASVCWESMEGTGIFQEDRARQIVDDVLDWIKTEYIKPNLGMATTRDLISELAARAEVHGYANYRTVDGY